MRSAIIAVTATLLAATSASAASFSTTRANDGSVVAVLNGEIVDGDADDLNAIIDKANDDGHEVKLLRLNSPGGNIAASVKIAELVRDGKIATSVTDRAKCASACFIVFAAGSQRFADPNALVGVHGASDESGKETLRSSAATLSMARILKDLGVPPGIIGKMVVTPPSEIVWLTREDLQSMGTTVVASADRTPPPDSGDRTPPRSNTANRTPARNGEASSQISSQFDEDEDSTSTQSRSETNSN
jgi:hypothetical protein